jgi:hypothetical protein
VWVPFSPFLFEWRWGIKAEKKENTWLRVDGSFSPNDDILLQQPHKTALAELISEFPAGFPKWTSRFLPKELLIWKGTP